MLRTYYALLLMLSVKVLLITDVTYFHVIMLLPDIFIEIRDDVK